MGIDIVCVVFACISSIEKKGLKLGTIIVVDPNYSFFFFLYLFHFCSILLCKLSCLGIFSERDKKILLR